MRRIVGALALSVCTAVGCGQNGSGVDHRPAFDNLAPQTSNPQRNAPSVEETAAAPSTRPNMNTSQVIAIVGKQPLMLEDLVRPLIAAHGLTMLLNVVRLEIIKQDAADRHVTVTADDIAQERRTTFDRMFADSPPELKLKEKLDKAVAAHNDVEAARLRDEISSQRAQFLEQFLADRHISQTEFDIVLEMNTYLRKIAEPQIKDRISEDDLQNAFGQLYGESARVRYIELNSIAEVQQAQRRIARGDKFEDVARDMSHNRVSAAEGGEMPPFTRSSNTLPKSFMDVVFSLKKGQVSDPVLVNNAFLVVKLEEKIPPKAVKYDDVKESVRQTLYDKLQTLAVRNLRESLDQQVLSEMKIKDPVLKQQFQAMIDRQTRDKQKISEEMERNRIVDTGPATAPTRPAAQGFVEPRSIPQVTLPDAAPSGPSAPAGDTRPPATQPGLDAAK